MNNIIFNRNDYYRLSNQIRNLYENIGDDVYALKSSSFTLDIKNLPQWLSINQYNANKKLVGSMYNLVTRGFSTNIIKLMELNYATARGIKNNYASLQTPSMAIITEKTFYKLAPEEKVKYNKIVKDSKIMYVTRGIPVSNLPTISQTSVRPPTVGIKQVPQGRWVEVR